MPKSIGGLLETFGELDKPNHNVPLTRRHLLVGIGTAAATASLLLPESADAAEDEMTLPQILAKIRTTLGSTKPGRAHKIQNIEYNSAGKKYTITLKQGGQVTFYEGQNRYIAFPDGVTIFLQDSSTYSEVSTCILDYYNTSYRRN